MHIPDPPQHQRSGVKATIYHICSISCWPNSMPSHKITNASHTRTNQFSLHALALQLPDRNIAQLSQIKCTELLNPLKLREKLEAGIVLFCCVSYDFWLQDEWCNRCGCRDGVLYCTRLPSCRYSDTESSSIPVEDRMCEECNSMTPRYPVYAKDQTFPSVCHAMRCNGIAASDISDVSCMSIKLNVGIELMHAKKLRL